MTPFEAKKCIMDIWIDGSRPPLHYFTLILGLNGAEASLPNNSIIVYLIYSTQLGKALEQQFGFLAWWAVAFQHLRGRIVTY